MECQRPNSVGLEPNAHESSKIMQAMSSLVETEHYNEVSSEFVGPLK